MQDFPKVVVSVILKKDGKILLAKEVLEDSREHWIIPGGKVEFGERLEDAAAREIKEELGIGIAIKSFLGFHEAVHTEHNYHTIIFFYEAEPLSGFAKINDNKILEAKYFSRDEIRELNLIDSARIILEKLHEI